MMKQPLKLSTADPPTCSPVRFSKRGQSGPVTHDFDKETGISDRDVSTDSESDSDESSGNVETYSSQTLCSPSLFRFHEETSTDIDLSHSNINNDPILESAIDNDRMGCTITESGCCACSRSPSSFDELQAQDRSNRRTRRVNFSPQLENMIEIPSHRILDPKVKEDLYTSIRIIHAEATRNRKEWDFELRNAQNVAEEVDFIPDCNGNLWHPAHWNPVI